MRKAEIVALLPDVYQQARRDGSPLDAVLDVMETLHAPAEKVLDEFDGYFDPRRAPEPFVCFLAGWVGLGRLLDARPGRPPTFSAGPGRLRELVVAAARLTRWRGTERGLVEFLRTATGHDGFRIEGGAPLAEGAPPRPFHFTVIGPAAARPHAQLVERIVQNEKPAYVTYDLLFDEE